jgi:putative alpha-1,2-mannosidase
MILFSFMKKIKMKIVQILIISSLSFLSVVAFSQAKSPLDYVNPFIGTAADHGQMDPAACVPFGMVKLGPDTRPLNHAGYDYLADTIIGFSHNRLSGTGCNGAGGDVRILPGVGAHYKAVKYLKETEFAEPGYYKVDFNNGIKVELTASNQIGYHRYLFPKSNEAWILIDLKSSYAGSLGSNFLVESNNVISGDVYGRNVCKMGRYKTSFYFVSSLPFKRYEVLPDSTLKIFYDINKTQLLELTVTLSGISPHQAKRDASVLLPNKSFEMVRNKARETWGSYLNKISLEGNEEYKTLFYSHLYHALLNPVNTTSTDSTFMGTDGRVYKADGYIHYDGWSMWDNFRNKFSLIALLYPELASDIGRSLIDLYRTGKSGWSGYFEPVPTVRTEHSLLVLLDFYKRGIAGIDLASIYEKLTYEVANLTPYSPDMQLEIAYDYWGMAQIADLLNKKEDAALFMEKAMDYPNGKYGWNRNLKVIDKLSDWMHAKGLYEGTVWQYRWHVQFDIPGLIDLMGGKEEFTKNLTFFYDSSLFNQGNQPSIHVPYMFNYSNAPWLTQKWVNKILTKETVNRYGTHNHFKIPYIGRIFKAEPAGFIPEMDNDDGTMSSWYVLSSMGLYSLIVGEPMFELTSPIFNKVVINLQQGKTFEIHANNFSDENFYITSCSLNGEGYSKTYISHQNIIQGGILEFDLSDKPNFKWGLNK